jgi:pyruvate dehydrogenase E1 component alpha subunit
MITTQEQSAAALAGDHGFSIISNEILLQIYAAILKSRLLGERLQLLVEQGKLDGLCKPQLGLEAVAAGVTFGLLPGDTVSPSPGDLIVNFIHGAPLEAIFTSAKNPSQATKLKQAVRAATKSKKVKNGRIAVVFADDDSCFPDEALNQASTQKLPILFVCQKRLVPEGVDPQASKIPVLPVDGNDAVAIYRVATESITHARRGNGPTLIECLFEPVEAHNPILKMESYLDRKGLFNEKLKLITAAAFKRELDAAVAVALR